MSTTGLFRSMALTAALSLGAAPAGAVTVWSAVDDFSIAANPNGAWAYGEGTAGSSFTAFTNAFTGGFGGNFNYWQSSTPSSGVPLVGKNIGAVSVASGTVVVPLGALEIHPGPSTDVLVQWTAPSASRYSYAGSFALQDIYPNGVIGEVYKNNAQLYSGLLTGPGASYPNAGQTELFSGAVSLSAGDKLTFAVNNAGNYYFDSTGLKATITAVPEPSSWALLLTGFAGLALAARRRKAALA